MAGIVSSEARTLLGDFVVATVELTSYPDRWLRLAIATAAAARGTAVPRELVDALIASLDLAALRTLVERVPHDDLWEGLWRSGLESVRDILEPLGVLDDTLREALDTAGFDKRMMESRGFVAREPPEGTPAYHWWWFTPSPPGERAIRMNERMHALLPPSPHVVAPPRFRALVAAGFVETNGLVFLRLRQPSPIPVTTKAMHETYLEGHHNFLPFYEVIDPDGSRRPVDMAATALACARYLAHEVRRRSMPPCRIVLTVDPSISMLTFHKVRAGQDWISKDGRASLETYVAANLALDTHAS